MVFVPSSAAAEPRAAGGTAPLSILILDDERFDRHRLARLCSGLDLVCGVTNAKTLLEFDTHLNDSTFGLILLDYALPDGTGLDALKMVQLCARNLNTPTVMISGQAAPLIAEQAHTIGCHGFLSKDDLSADSFAAAIKHALRDTVPAGPTSGTAPESPEVEALLALCARQCARDIKPMVSRLLRQMRDLRASQSARRGAPQTDALVPIEQNCMSLWAFLIEMERQEGAVLLADLSAASPKTPLAAPLPDPVQKRAKPPSPFSARRH